LWTIWNGKGTARGNSGAAGDVRRLAGSEARVHRVGARGAEALFGGAGVGEGARGCYPDMMTSKKPDSTRLLLALTLGAAAPVPAIAQSDMGFPARPIRVLVGFAPGGSADIVARIIGQRLGEALKQTVVVDNRAGASGIIATDLAAKATPDGYTLLAATMTTHGIGPSLFSKLPYDPVKDFAPVIATARIPLIMVSHPSVPATNVKELVALAKAKPGQLSFASAGNGSPPHLAGELFKLKTGVNLLHVPYKGTGATVADLVAGQVQLIIDGPPPFLPHVKAGKLRALASASARRNPLLPDVSTFAELGFQGMEVDLWYGLMSAAGTPKPVVALLNTEVNRVLALPDVRERFSAIAVETMGGTPEQFGRFIGTEIARWREVVKAANVKVE